MECGICYEKIEEYKYFKMGCCSLIQCLDCAHHTNNGKCPQCKQGYKWVKTLTPEYKILLADHSKLIEDHDRLLSRFNVVSANYNRKLEQNTELVKCNTIAKQEKLNYIRKINEYEKNMDEMVKTIYELIAEKEVKEEQEAEKEEEAELVEDLQSVVNRLNLLP